MYCWVTSIFLIQIAKKRPNKFVPLLYQIENKFDGVGESYFGIEKTTLFVSSSIKIMLMVQDKVTSYANVDYVVRIPSPYMVYGAQSGERKFLYLIVP